MSMKKIFTLVAAALMSASMFAQPATVPTVTDLADAGYDLTGRVICLYFDEQVCTDIVWAGSYNEWSTTPVDMMSFMPLEGYNGWYVIELWDDSNPCQGRPVQLKKDGSFSWDFQSGDVEAWINMAQPGTKTATISAGNNQSEANCTWPDTGAYIYEVAYFKNHNTPCGAPDPAPELTAPPVPTVDAANVKAIMCETYSNNLGYWPQGWGGCNWADTCKAGVNIKYAKTMAWDCFASDWQGAGVAGYANLHFCIWFAEDGNAPVVKLEFNGTDPTAEITIPGEYKAGWNSVNVNVEETFGKQSMNDLKCLTVKVTKEGGPVAWANILFYNGDYTSTAATGTCHETPVWPEDAPTTAPAAPTVDGASILGAALDPSYAFEPLDWPGAMPQLLTFETGETIYYMSKMTWQIYTNWAKDFYDMSGYNMLHVDLYPATGTEIKITFECLSVDDGGQGYKNSVVKTLTAGQWNALDIALSEFPAFASGDPYDFSDFRYFILEGYNAEQTALTVGNVYFYSNPTDLPKVDGTGITVNGRKYGFPVRLVKEVK